MAKAATTSPFMVIEEALPWIVWQQNHDVLQLEELIETESRASLVSEKLSWKPLTEEIHLPVSIPIQRKQYQAVVSKITQASNKAGNFSAWHG